MTKPAYFFLIIAISLSLISIASNIFLFQKFSQSETTPTSSIQSSLQAILPRDDSNEINNLKADECGVNCRNYIDEVVSKNIASVEAKIPTTIATPKSAAVISSKQTTYISLVGPVSTTSTDWIDVPGTETSIDLQGDYGKNASVVWEPSIKIMNGGTAYARLIDKTHGIVVLGSEVTSNSASFETVTSGGLNLWSGKNTYKVQIKSLNANEVTFGSGRIKIVY